MVDFFTAMMKQDATGKTKNHKSRAYPIRRTSMFSVCFDLVDVQSFFISRTFSSYFLHQFFFCWPRPYRYFMYAYLGVDELAATRMCHTVRNSTTIHKARIMLMARMMLRISAILFVFSSFNFQSAVQRNTTTQTNWHFDG